MKVISYWDKHEQPAWSMAETKRKPFAILLRLPRPTQPSIPPGSVNEYQLRLRRQR